MDWFKSPNTMNNENSLSTETRSAGQLSSAETV